MKRIALAALVVATGCSMALQKKPATGTAVGADGCSTTPLYWIADAVLVAGSIAAISYGIYDKENDASATLGGVGAFAFVGSTASMANGIRWMRQCRGQREQNQAALLGMRP